MTNLLKMIMKQLCIGIEILVGGLALFLVLPFCMVSGNIREKAYRHMRLLVPAPIPFKTRKFEVVFDICVLWLLWGGELTHKSYNEVNIWIFCVLWPLVTIASIVLNVVLLTR